MTIQQLFLELIKSNTARYKDLSCLDQDVSGIFFDARKVQKNSVFVAVRGTKSDGHNFISEAVEKGAIALVIENEEMIPSSFTGLVLVVSDARQALDVLAATYFDNPSLKLICLGITGTNGKTSITYLLEHILNENKKLTGVMGTVNHRVGDKVWESQMTTPDPVTLQERLHDFLKERAFAAALEVSSHALDQKRASSVHFNTVIFTNLTQDHLDYHPNMNHYFESKQKLFTDQMWSSRKRPLFAVINTDDSFGRRLKVAEPVLVWTYGQQESDFQFKITNMDFNGTDFELTTPIDIFKVHTHLSGLHNVYNVVACIAAALTCGVTVEQSINALKSFYGIPGRLQKVDSHTQKTVFVDYAHTPDALENTLKTLIRVRDEAKLKSKIICVFGCGGDRDKSKRPLMAAIAEKYSDYVWITSDNPRTENPDQIIIEIKSGISSGFKKVSVEANRELAIKLAIQNSEANDIILIAGKGHEDYQIIGFDKQHFSDVEIAKKYLR